MTNRSRTAAKLAGALGLLGLLATLVGLAPSANAAEQPFTYILLDGSVVNVGSTEFPLFDPANPTSAGVTGIIDDATGDFEGDLVIPSRVTQQRVTSPIAGNIDLQVDVAADPIVGNIDFNTNEVNATAVIDVSMTFVQLVPDVGNPLVLNVTCTMENISMDLSSNPDGEPFDPNANPTTFAVADDGFVFPEPTCGPSGAQPDPAPATVDLVRSNLISTLELPNSDTTAFLSFESGTLTPPEPLPTTTTTARADINCDPNVPQAEEQRILDQDRSDPHGLDDDKDGIACEDPDARPAQAIRAQPRVTG